MVDVSLILPAFNENRIILNSIQEAIQYFESRNYTFEIIVAADGTDGTRETVNAFGAKDPRVKAIGSPVRKGKGHGIKEAMEIANAKFIGFADADNKVPITELDRVLPLLMNGTTDMVIGSRALKESKIQRKQPLYRQIGSRGFRYAMKLVTGLWDVHDTQCGFKFFKGSLAKELFSQVKINGYMFDVEIIYLARAQKIPFVQLPISWRDDGDSRLQVFRGNLQNAVDLLKIRFAQ